MAGAGAEAGSRPTRASRRLALAKGEDGSPLKSLPTINRRTTKGRRATVEKAPARDASDNTDKVLQSREETDSRSTSPAPQQKKPLRRSARTVSRSVSPTLKPLPTTKPRQTAGRATTATPRKVAEPNTAGTRRKKAAVVAELPSITESPVKSPPGAFPVDSPPRSSAHYTTSLELTPAHLGTATKRAHDSSTDRSVESHSNLSLFKRSRTDDWTPSKQLLSLTSEYAASSIASPVADHTVNNDDVVAFGNTSTTPSNNTSSNYNQSSDAVVSAGSTHSSPASSSDGGPTPVAHGLFARLTSYIPSFSARAPRFQVRDAPVEVASPTPKINNNANNFTSSLVSTTAAPEKASESPVASITPLAATTPVVAPPTTQAAGRYVSSKDTTPRASTTPVIASASARVARHYGSREDTTPLAASTPVNASASARVTGRYGSLEDTTPEFLKPTSTKPTSTKPNFHLAAKRWMPDKSNVDDAGYESDEEVRDILDAPRTALLSSVLREKNRAYLRKVEKDFAAKKARDLEAKKARDLEAQKVKDLAAQKAKESVPSQDGTSESGSTNGGFIQISVDALYIPAAASSASITITDNSLTAKVRAFVTANMGQPATAVLLSTIGGTNGDDSSMTTDHISQPATAGPSSTLDGTNEDNIQTSSNRHTSNSKPPATPRSAFKGNRPQSQDDDIHQAQRQARRVNWGTAKERDNESLEPSSTQNENGKRVITKGDYSADDLQYSDSSDEDEEPSNKLVDPSTAAEPEKRKVPRGDYSADIYDSDEEDSDTEITNDLSDAKLAEYVTGEIEFDIPFIKSYEQSQPQAALRMFNLLKARLRAEKAEKDKKEKDKKEKEAAGLPKPSTSERYRAGNFHTQHEPAFGALSPLSERSESSFVEAEQSTPLPPSGGRVETLPASGVAPLRERSANPAPAVPVTPLRKSYTPVVSSALRNVTNASSPGSPSPRPLFDPEVVAAVDAAPLPDFFFPAALGASCPLSLADMAFENGALV